MPRTGRPRLTVKRSEPIKALVYPEDAKAFERACKAAKLNAPDVLRELAKAWVEYVAKNPHATLHFELRDSKSLK